MAGYPFDYWTQTAEASTIQVVGVVDSAAKPNLEKPAAIIPTNDAMKNTNKARLSPAFTLVELLVVFVIMASLAALAMAMFPRVRMRADFAKSVQNMRQIGSLFGVYASENSFRLPPMRVQTGGDIHWHQSLLAYAYSDVDPAKFGDSGWWMQAKPFLRNPLMTDTLKPHPFRPYWCGYAMNRQIQVNAGLDQSLSFSVPLSAVTDQARTPIVAPRNDYTYNLADLKSDAIKPFLMDGKLPILFVDGHIETMKVSEYESRRLNLMPR
jgi:type II secretory pathway pseudopilin PulG